ncbi:dihydrolipoamide acetyltransferase family protein [Telluria aromaticivorans]|uniref:Dihydrolipoamide acetyltransferase component of pyruvate dehydrogenase complex n=1 Tax=Telluria aromaticivorans TaxID=2725995 RepID=A0A7Y2JXK1_9BURK|nr:dihydrolipoamide acetyltransferase family protein [Telluria aromaticivorans]NNG21589.1 2-oxo acid dehydrogenase subunit E2 [Telluria aromaticivorans]
MGIHVIKMPDLGEGIAEVEVVAWHVQPGDTVKEDQVLADVMTDKATVEIPSPVAGTITSLGGAIGQAMAVGAELIRLEVAGAGNYSGDKAKQEPVKSAASKAPAEEVGEPQLEAVAQAEASAPAARAPAAAAAPAQQKPQQKAHQHAPSMRAEGDKPHAAPAVRQRAWDLGIELQFVHGSGPAGRITHADLDEHVAGRRQGGNGGGSDNRYAMLEGEHATPIIGLRRKIAEKMQEAKRQIPHFTYVEEIDVTELELLRAQLNARYGADRGKLTLLPLVMRAVVLSIRAFPMMNARYDDEANLLTRYDPVHLGIATQTEAGLMVPVVRHAEARDPWASSAEVARLADAARTGKATRDELTGSTITITSLGPLGGIVTTPVINRPEVAIIGTNRIVDRPVIRDGAMVARKMMNLSSSFDHRVIDGQVAAKFVQAIRGYLETPATIFVE